MSDEVRREVLAGLLKDFLDNPPMPIPDDLPFAGHAVFEAMIKDWDGLSRFSQGKLLLAVAILAKHVRAENAADMTTAEIIAKLKQGG